MPLTQPYGTQPPGDPNAPAGYMTASKLPAAQASAPTPVPAPVQAAVREAPAARASFETSTAPAIRSSGGQQIGGGPLMGGSGKPQIGAGDAPQVGAGRAPQMGAGRAPQMGAGRKPQMGAGPQMDKGKAVGGPDEGPARKATRVAREESIRLNNIEFEKQEKFIAEELAKGQALAQALGLPAPKTFEAFEREEEKRLGRELDGYERLEMQKKAIAAVDQQRMAAQTIMQEQDAAIRASAEARQRAVDRATAQRQQALQQQQQAANQMMQARNFNIVLGRR